MIETRILIHTLLILCLFGLGLTIAADEWNGARRWKIAVVLILIGYAGLYGLR